MAELFGGLLPASTAGDAAGRKPAARRRGVAFSLGYFSLGQTREK
jgi:hypothetical protein